MEKRIIVIGGGPAGYAAAIKAAQLGASVILAEEHKIGGTCLNCGCVPAKTLLRTAVFYHNASLNAIPGVVAKNVSLDWDGAQKNKETIVSQLSNGVSMLLKRNGVTVYNEKALMLSPTQVRVGNETLQADAIIIAAGSISAPLSLPGKKSSRLFTVDSAAALSLERLPESIVIVGGGVVGVEFAVMFRKLGIKTAIIEQAPRLLPSADAEVAEYLKMTLEADGVDVYTNANIVQSVESKNMVTLTIMSDSQTGTVAARTLLAAAGRSPNTAGLGFEGAGIKISRGAIITDDNFQTNVSGIYAVGDCNGKVMLAHAAMAQGETAAEHIMGMNPCVSTRLIPACIYSYPEIAYIGMTEEQLKSGGVEFSVGRFDLAGNSKSIIEGSGGFVKILADRRLGEILGVHIVGPGATELIAEAAMCMNMEGTVEDIVSTVHAHPTVSEAMRESAMSVFGKPLHGI